MEPNLELVEPKVLAFLHSVPKDSWFSDKYASVEAVARILALRVCDPTWAPRIGSIPLTENQLKMESIAALEELSLALDIAMTCDNSRDVAYGIYSYITQSRLSPPTRPVEEGTCYDCGDRTGLKATWRFMPCGCAVICGCCAKLRWLESYTRCPACNKWNMGKFKHV